jgi:hypothetical protein
MHSAIAKLVMPAMPAFLKRGWWILGLFLLLSAATVFAGQNCIDRPATATELRSALALGSRVRNALEFAGAKTAVIGRIGSDLREYGLRYSHIAFVQRDSATGRWIVVQLLNHCGTADSALFEDGLGNFFLDHPVEYEAVLVIPSPALQARIDSVLTHHIADNMHNPRYNMIANAHATQFQNSNQWVLESLALALAWDGQINGRDDAQRYLFASGYRAGVLQIGPGKRLGARIFAANVSFADHPMSAFSSNRFEVVTAESVLSFMKRVDPLSAQQILRLDGVARVAR